MKSGAESTDQPCRRALWIAPVAGHFERSGFEEYSGSRLEVLRFSGVCRSLPNCFTVWAFSGAFDCCISEHAWQAANVQIDYKAALQTWASGGQAGLIVLSDISEMAALYLLDVGDRKGQEHILERVEDCNPVAMLSIFTLTLHASNARFCAQ